MPDRNPTVWYHENFAWPAKFVKKDKRSRNTQLYESTVVIRLYSIHVKHNDYSTVQYFRSITSAAAVAL
jgi:hypothetical protein